MSDADHALDRLRSDIQHGINSMRLPDCYAASVALDALVARVRQLEDGLAKIQKFQPNRLAWYQGLNIVFKRAPGCAPTEWEAIAFWTYTDLCEIEAIARALLADSPPDGGGAK